MVCSLTIIGARSGVLVTLSQPRRLPGVSRADELPSAVEGAARFSITARIGKEGYTADNLPIGWRMGHRHGLPSH